MARKTTVVISFRSSTSEQTQPRQQEQQRLISPTGRSPTHRRDHLPQLLDASEEPDDSEGPHQPHQPVRDIEWPKIHHGHDDDEQIQPIPTAPHEFARQVCKHVHAKLQRKDPCEDIVDAENQAIEPRGTVLFVLRVKHANDKILPWNQAFNCIVFRNTPEEYSRWTYRYNQDRNKILERF